MPTTSNALSADARAALDALFAVRVALAALPQERNAALIRLVPPELRETVAATLREFQDLEEVRTTEAEQLVAQIHRMVKDLGMPVRSTHLQATYSPGRRSWDTDGLLRLAARLPEIHGYLRQGEPIITIRARAQRKAAAPLLYDVHGT
jgi:hypothetical protein